MNSATRGDGVPAVMEAIRLEVSRLGPIPFFRFMEIALYLSGEGYYARSHPVGRDGDFITAPKVGPAFGWSLGRHFASWARAGSLDTVDLVELGAGDGTLVADVVRSLAPSISIRSVVLVERGVVPAFPPLEGAVCRHVRSLDELPSGSLEGVIYANELLDALPVVRARREAGRIWESHVDIENGHLVERWLPSLDPEIHSYADRYLIGEDSCTFELSRSIPHLLKGIARVLRSGMVLFLDYGGRSHEVHDPEHCDGTLRAFFEHRLVQDLFERPGFQDLTADVNFDFVRNEAELAGFVALPLQRMGSFLLNAGLTEAPSAGIPLSTGAVRQLVMPGAMGDVFRVLVLARS